MDPSVRNLLYDEPRLYDLVFPDADDTIGKMCRAAFARYLPAPPASVLDVGCGTGRHLESLSATVPECWGVDYLETNVAHARARRSTLVIQPGGHARRPASDGPRPPDTRPGCSGPKGPSRSGLAAPATAGPRGPKAAQRVSRGPR